MESPPESELHQDGDAQNVVDAKSTPREKKTEDAIPATVNVNEKKTSTNNESGSLGQTSNEHESVSTKKLETPTIGKSVKSEESTNVEIKKSIEPKEKQTLLKVDADLLSTQPDTPPCKQESTKVSPLPDLASATPVIPLDMLSPPKSESQTDETNTATTSPASDTQLSPKLEIVDVPNPVAVVGKESANGKNKEVAPNTSKPSKTQSSINVVANGTIPKSGKPLLSTINKKVNKPPRPAKARKPKALVAMYESEISHNKVGIKLCIKKSEAGAVTTTTAKLATAATTVKTSGATTAPAAKNRKRARKTKKRVDSDDSEYETKRKKKRNTNNNTEQSSRQKKVSFSGSAGGSIAESGDELDGPKVCVDQGVWGSRLPEEILTQIFQHVVNTDGCIPTLFRLGRVCTLWRRVSLRPSLWKSMDLSNWIKEKYRTELKLKWFVDNRCSGCTELNIANWKITNIDCFLHKLANGCPNLEGITLTGWKGFTCDHLAFLVENMTKLERIDLSSVNVEMNPSKSAVGLNSLRSALSTMNERLTQLYLAHNRLPGIPQIIDSLATYCPNLVILDLSNVFTQAASHAVLHVEKLQRGCRKLRVLRATNSRMSLNPAPMQEVLDSPGFPDLEELSVAALSGDESRLIGDEHLQRILKASSKLKLLDVRGCTRLTHESLIRLPAWDIKHLFLSGCSVTRDFSSRLELIAAKWAHSLIELDLAWTNVQQPLDSALRVLAEKGAESPLAHLNLCGSSVSEDAVMDILANCAHMNSINLSSCRGLRRGLKRLIQGPEELRQLREVLKVQMKVKLPSELKLEATHAAESTTSSAKIINDDGGGGGGGGSGDRDGDSGGSG